MSENRFSLENLAPSWVGADQIIKGDLPGHPFRGNQYAEASELADKATELAGNRHPSGGLSDEQPNIGTIRDNQKAYYTKMAEGHQELADRHGALSQASFAEHRENPSNSAIWNAARHLDAQTAHQDAATMYQKMADGTNVLDGPDSHAKTVANALTATAAVASERARGLSSSFIPGEKTGPDGTILPYWS